MQSSFAVVEFDLLHGYFYNYSEKSKNSEIHIANFEFLILDESVKFNFKFFALSNASGEYFAKIKVQKLYSITTSVFRLLN